MDEWLLWIKIVEAILRLLDRCLKVYWFFKKSLFTVHECFTPRHIVSS